MFTAGERVRGPEGLPGRIMTPTVGAVWESFDDDSPGIVQVYTVVLDSGEVRRYTDSALSYVGTTGETE